MSILIKDMEMPKNCLECVFYRTSSQDYDYCCISSAIPKGYIPADCPLIELPDHLTDAIEDAPTIDPVKHGKWTYDDESNTGIYAICSACGESVYQAGEWRYCPRCGAQMERREE